MPIQVNTEPLFIATVKESGVVVNLSAATNLRLRFRKSGVTNTVIEVTPTFVTDGTDGQVQYDVNNQATLLMDDNGVWYWQVKGTLSNGRDFYTDIKKFKVVNNL